MTTTKTKPRQPRQERAAKSLPVEIPPAPTAGQLDDFEREGKELLNELLDTDGAEESTTNPGAPGQSLANSTNEEIEEAKTADDTDVADGEESKSESKSEHLRPSATSAVDTPAPAPTSAEAHLDKIKAARAVVADRERTYRSLKAKAKAAKESFEEAVDDLTTVIDDGEEYLPLFDGKAPEPANAANELTTNPGAPGQSLANSTNESQPAPVNDAWRSASVFQLGLSEKITDKLIEAGCGTIGELEDRRASHKGLKSISGIGDKKITIIEDAILKWLTENRDKEVFDRSAGQNDQPTQPDSTDPHVAQIHARAAELDNGEPDGLHQKIAGKPYWDDGKKAYNAGEPLEYCQWVPGEEQDDWIRGWLFAAPIKE